MIMKLYSYRNVEAVIVIASVLGIFLRLFYTITTSKELATPSISATAIDSFYDVSAGISKKRFFLLSLSCADDDEVEDLLLEDRREALLSLSYADDDEVEDLLWEDRHDGKFVGGRSSSHYLFVSRSCKCRLWQ